MAKQFARVRSTEQDLSEVSRLSFGIEQIKYFLADRGPHLSPVRVRTVKALRQIFGPRPTGDLNFFAMERALKNGATIHAVRLLHLTDPTDISTLTAVAAFVNVSQQVGGASNEYIFRLSELGAGGNRFQVTIAAGTTANTFKATLHDLDELVADEVYDNLSVDSNIGANYFITRLNTNNPGRLRGTDSTPNPTPTYPNELPTFGTYALASGSNGTAINAASIIGDSAAGTGFFAANAALARIEVVAAHQFISSDDAVVAAGNAYGESADMVMFQGPPDQTSFSDAVDFRNGTGIYSHTAFDSSYGALEYGQPRVFDVAQGVDVFLPNSSERAPQLVKAFDRSLGGAFWLAPAGGKRGGVATDVQGLSDDLGPATRQADADAIADADYNPLATQSGALKFWGNSTLLIDDTKLTSRLHVRFLMIGLRRLLLSRFNDWLFDPNRPITWKALSLDVIPRLEALKAQGAFANFRYEGDQDAQRADDQDQLTVNDVNDLAAGFYKVRIVIQPYSAIDQEIAVEFQITSTAVNFEEFFAAAA